jgi:hypothetical protein
MPIARRNLDDSQITRTLAKLFEGLEKLIGLPAGFDATLAALNTARWCILAGILKNNGLYVNNNCSHLHFISR